MEIKGVIKAVMEVRSGAKKDGGQWHSQTVVLHVEDEKFPKDLALDISGDICGSINIGDKVSAQFDVSSREWNGKWFTSARAWKVEVTEKAPASGGDGLPF